MFYCLSVNLEPEFRCVIWTGVTLFTLVFNLIMNCSALSKSELSNFFMYIISNLISSSKRVVKFVSSTVC